MQKTPSEDTQSHRYISHISTFYTIYIFLQINSPLYQQPKANKVESGGGFDDVMKAMKSNPTFSQRERNSSLHSVESVPSSPAAVHASGTFQPPPLKHVRQHSLPDSVGAQHLRRSSEPEAILKTRKNVASELDRYIRIVVIMYR